MNVSDRSVQVKGLQEAVDAVDGEIARKASVRSVNEITAQGKTATSRKIRDTYTIKAKALSPRMAVLKLSQLGGGKASIKTVGSRFDLGEFTGTRVLKSGVSFQIRASGTRVVFKWAFSATMKSGAVIIAERRIRSSKGALGPAAPVGKKMGGGAPKKPYRLPIQRIASLGAASMFDQDQIYAEVQTLVDAKYEAVFQRNFAFYSGIT